VDFGLSRFILSIAPLKPHNSSKDRIIYPTAVKQSPETG